MITKFKGLYYYLISFLLPSTIMFLVLFSKGIFWNSSKTILASDGFHQYVIFAQNLRNILHGSDSIFYTFTSGLGLNFYALMSYYLGSFLSPFYFFFNLKSMPNAIYVFTIIKFGLIGLSTFFSLQEVYSAVKKHYLIILSSSFALMSFLTSQLEINTWLDVFIIIPIVILGLHHLFNNQFILYYVSLTVLFIQNYYFGYMFSIFLVLYVLVLLVKENDWKNRIKIFIHFSVLSFLAAMSSAIMLFPTLLDLKTHGEKLTKVSTIITENTWFFDLLSKSSIGAYDTTKFNAIPMIYVGLFPLLLTCLYFTIKSINWKIKIAYVTLILFIFISYYIQPLDLFWQGMHSPNMFLHRYAWTVPLILIILSCETLNHLKELTVTNVLIVFVFLSAFIAIPYFFTERYHFLQFDLFLLSLCFLTAYAIILVSLIEFHFPLSILIVFTVIFTILEISLNSFYMISGVDNEWVFPTRKGYSENLEAISTLVDDQKKKDSSFYRTERILGQTGNDSMKYNYYGISQFSSIRNRNSSQILDRLGFKSEGTNLNLRYQNNTLIADSLFGIKYNISENNLSKYGFTKINQKNNTRLYYNQYASQLAILTDSIYKDCQFTVNTLDNQTQFINQIAGTHFQYYQEEISHLLSGATNINNRVNSHVNDSSKDTLISYQLEVSENKQLYLSLPHLTVENPDEKSVIIRVNGKIHHYTTDNSFSFFDLGYFENSQLLKIDIIFPKQKTVSFDLPHFYSLDIQNYQKVFQKITKKNSHVKQSKNNLSISYSTPNDASLLITLPYDKGWKAEQNGKKLPILKAQRGFMKINVKKGSGTINMVFVPNGFKLGILTSLLGVCLFLGFNKIITGKKKK